MEFDVWETGDRCHARFYNIDMFDASTIERMLGHYEHLLAAAVSRSVPPIADLPLLTEDERHQLLVRVERHGA